MEVFQIIAEGTLYGIAAKNEELAFEFLKNEYGIEKIDSSEWVPEFDDKWDRKFIIIYPDNDTSKKPFHISIREAIIGEEAQLIFSNDIDIV